MHFWIQKLGCVNDTLDTCIHNPNRCIDVPNRCIDVPNRFNEGPPCLIHLLTRCAERLSRYAHALASKIHELPNRLIYRLDDGRLGSGLDDDQLGCENLTVTLFQRRCFWSTSRNGRDETEENDKCQSLKNTQEFSTNLLLYTA